MNKKCLQEKLLFSVLSHITLGAQTFRNVSIGEFHIKNCVNLRESKFKEQQNPIYISNENITKWLMNFIITLTLIQ